MIYDKIRNNFYNYWTLNLFPKPGLRVHVDGVVLELLAPAYLLQQQPGLSVHVDGVVLELLAPSYLLQQQPGLGVHGDGVVLELGAQQAQGVVLK